MSFRLKLRDFDYFFTKIEPMKIRKITLGPYVVTPSFPPHYPFSLSCLCGWYTETPNAALTKLSTGCFVCLGIQALTDWFSEFCGSGLQSILWKFLIFKNLINCSLLNGCLQQDQLLNFLIILRQLYVTWYVLPLCLPSSPFVFLFSILRRRFLFARSVFEQGLLLVSRWRPTPEHDTQSDSVWLSRESTFLLPILLLVLNLELG